jgi:putative ATP-dependent endonuclease of the OLD family
MKIENIHIGNYRSLENVNIQFPNYYTALCGKNNAGKSSVVRALRAPFLGDDEYSYEEEPIVSWKKDCPFWKNKEESTATTLELRISVGATTDAGLFKFITTVLGTDISSDKLTLTISTSCTKKNQEPKLQLTVDGTSVDEYKAQEIIKKAQALGCIIYHNSTEPDLSWMHRRGFANFSGTLSEQERTEIDKAKSKLTKAFGKLIKRQQTDISALLGRLKETYVVGINPPDLALEYLPYQLSLGHKGASIPLDAWGSGTRNRTNIFVALLRAKSMQQTETIGSRIAPILIIEEPESFLHSSAQAEFGRTLQELAEEFKIQVITTTHSPYMLSQKNPCSNVLLERITEKNILKATIAKQVHGEKWMEPFGLSLGIVNTEFEPWENLFFNKSENLLLVEGEIDKDYFELLLCETHGKHKLNFEGEIYPYGGTGNLKNQILLKFIKGRFKNVFVTFDADEQGGLSPILDTLGFVEGHSYLSIGINAPGKNNIEGLIPDSIRSVVYSENPAIVQVAMSSEKEASKDAKRELKKLLLKKFKQAAQPGESDYGHFYKITKTINRALSKIG